MNNEIKPLNYSVPASQAGNYDNSTCESAIDIDSIDSIFTTDKTEDKRTTFKESFEELSLNDELSCQGKQFLEGLKNNKESLCNDLGLSEEQYSALSCIALALASQETGMGLEKGYKEENSGLLASLRLTAIFIKGKIEGTGSASSGLTQMKINDFVKAYEDNPEKYALFEKYGIETSGTSKNNLFEEPDKAAIATMIVLSDIISNDYERYENVLKNSHSEIRKGLNPGMTNEECLEKGLNTIDSIQDAYNKLSPEKQEELRLVFKQWLLSYNGSVDNFKYLIEHMEDSKYEYNEEKQLANLNNIIKESGFQLKQEDLDYIRYALTNEDQEMNIVEYAAYAWHCGTGKTGMQLDRLIAEKIGTIFLNPEDFDYDQFTVNVETLAGKYAKNSNADIDTVINLLQQYIQD